MGDCSALSCQWNPLKVQSTRVTHEKHISQHSITSTSHVSCVLAIGWECHVMLCLQAHRLHSLLFLMTGICSCRASGYLLTSISWDGGSSKMLLHLLRRGPRLFVIPRLRCCSAAAAPAGVEVAREVAHREVAAGLRASRSYESWNKCPGQKLCHWLSMPSIPPMVRCTHK